MVQHVLPRLRFEFGSAVGGAAEVVAVPSAAAAWPAGGRAVDRGTWRTAFAEVFGRAPLRILDVRAREGEVALLLSAMGRRSRGVEVSVEIVRLERRSADARCSLVPSGHGDDLAFPDGTFDAVHARDVLGTLADPASAAREWCRVLRPGGLAFVAESAAGMRPAEFLARGGFADISEREAVVPQRCEAGRAGARRWLGRWSPARRRYSVAWGRRP